MTTKERESFIYLRGWVGAMAAAVSSMSIETHIARPLVECIGTTEEIEKHANASDVDILKDHNLLT